MTKTKPIKFSWDIEPKVNHTACKQGLRNQAAELKSQDMTSIDLPSSASNILIPWETLRQELLVLSDPPSFPEEKLAYIDAHWPHYANDVRQEFLRYTRQPGAELIDNQSIHLYAGCLLAQHRDADCFEAAQQLAQFSDEQLEATIADTYTETLTPWLAAWCHQSQDRLQWLRQVSCAQLGHAWNMAYHAHEALTICRVEGLLTQTEYCEITQSHCEFLINAIRSGNTIDPAYPEDIFDAHAYLGFAVANWLDIGFSAEHLKLIEGWFADGWLDDEIVDLKLVKREYAIRLKAAKSDNEKNLFSALADHLPGTVKEQIGWWAWFNPEEPRHPTRDVEPSLAFGHFPDNGAFQMPIMRDTPKVGRNELCPCGSGKKYKKCCGA